MPLASLKTRESVLSAVSEFDRMGREAFLKKYEFGRARSYFLLHDGKEYDSKAIVAAAYGYEFPEEGPLKASEFSGGEATVKRKLEELGFEVVQQDYRQVLVQGQSYTRRDISQLLGGDEQSYIPQKDNRIVCGAFDPEMNPEVPRAIYVGEKASVLRKAELLCKQHEPIPVFLKQSTNEWVYDGEYFVADWTEDPKALERAEQDSGRPSLTRIIYLERLDTKKQIPATIEELRPGSLIDNDRLCDIFKCSKQGGMRRSNTTNTLVLVSNHTKSVYGDRWIGDVLHYTGMGLTGDQSLSASQNRTLAESNKSGVEVHLFEVHEEKQYSYVGKVGLARKPYPEIQADEEGVERTVWMFPLCVLEGESPTLSEEKYQELQKRREKQARRLSDDELNERATKASSKPGERKVSSRQYERDPHVSESAKRKADGICQLCEEVAPFNSKDGSPYLETHHIIWLSRGGEDSLGNTVALCPNCHRKMHVLDLREDKEKLRQTVSKRGF